MEALHQDRKLHFLRSPGIYIYAWEIREPLRPPLDWRLAAAFSDREAPIEKNGRSLNEFPGINAWAK